VPSAVKAIRGIAIALLICASLATSVQVLEAEHWMNGYAHEPKSIWQHPTGMLALFLFPFAIAIGTTSLLGGEQSRARGNSETA